MSYNKNRNVKEGIIDPSVMKTQLITLSITGVSDTHSAAHSNIIKSATGT